MEKEKNTVKCCLTLSSEKKDSNMINVNLDFTPALNTHGTAPEAYSIGLLLFRTLALYSSDKDFCDTLTSFSKDSNRVNINLEFNPALEKHGTAPEAYSIGVLLFRTLVFYSSNKNFRDALIELLERYQEQSQERRVHQEAVNE